MTAGLRFDNFIHKIPGSTSAKAAVLAFAITGVCAIPSLGRKKAQQGEDLFSQEKPEEVAAGQDRVRRERNKNQQQQQQQPPQNQSS